ncbi:MAG: hypothetical protein L0Y58_19845 [Verrucomicrobia subdivision 3 bacterium]|nr:hypothetical protein [Limisphaerales bacterium]
MRTRRLIKIVGAVLAIVFVAVSIRAFVVYRRAQELQEGAAVRDVQNSAMRALHTYYVANKRYPKSLTELPTRSFTFTRPGASLDLLKRLNYKSDGPRYMLTRPGKDGIHKVSVIGAGPPVWEFVYQKKE